MFAGLDRRDEYLPSRNCHLNNGLRENGKSTNKRSFGAGDESATTSNFVKPAYRHGCAFERSAAGSAHSMADSHYHDHARRLCGWSNPATATPNTATIDDGWIYEPRKLPHERRRIQRPVPCNSKHNDCTPKTAVTHGFPFDITPEWDDWRTPHHLPNPQRQPGGDPDLPPFQPLSIHDPRLKIYNTPPSPSISPYSRPFNTHQASTPPNIYPPNPSQPFHPQNLNCGKSLETMEVEAAFILMVIRHRTPEAAAMAISRELRLAQEEQQSRRAGSPCGSEDTVVASEFDDGEE